MKRGDIGPISDDIPSIFPIVFGVLLFMGTAMYSAQRIDERNEYLDLRKSLVGLSYVALNKGYISDAEFDAQCTSQYADYADRRRVNFVVSLKKFCRFVSFDQSISSVFSTATNYGVDACNETNPNCIDSAYARTGKLCPNPPPSVTTRGVSSQIGPANLPPNFQMLNFPISVQCTRDATVKGPGMTSIVIWR